MKQIAALCVCFIASLVVMSALAQERVVHTFPTGKIRDLALIYQGGAKRIDWTKEQFVPYVTHTFADGHTDWLFDGFLFLDFNDGRGHTFIPAFGEENATKEDWSWYLDRLFERGKSLDALDTLIGELRQSMGDPGFKHKVVLTLLTPITKFDGWGEVDGKELDFNNRDDQVEAVRWYIEQLVPRFKQQHYKNLTLSGLYWVDEDMCHTFDLATHVAPLVHRHKLDYVWIPYYKARGTDHWRDYGFDIVYHQPNYFFKDTIPMSQLTGACDYALQHGMAMEFECDAKALHDSPNSYYSRMNDYINVFERYGAFRNSPIAYYTGSKGFIDMFNSTSPQDHAIMDRLARLIVDRRNIKTIVKR